MNDIMLFDELDDTVDMFDEIDLFNLEETDSLVAPQVETATTELDPDLIQKSVQEFYEIFRREEGELSIGSSAIILHQHLSNSGYQTDLSIEDNKAWVKASTSLCILKEALIERVESLLDDMCYIERAWSSDSFTVHSVLTKTKKNSLEVQINFKTVK